MTTSFSLLLNINALGLLTDGQTDGRNAVGLSIALCLVSSANTRQKWQTATRRMFIIAVFSTYIQYRYTEAVRKYLYQKPRWIQ